MSLTVKENRFTKFYTETRSELRKVVWPSRKEWVNLTIVVIATSIAVGGVLGLIDYVFERLILLVVP
ncbi:MAG: preprotein translocase subunit SecE [Chloroflexota bacterium]|nr:preprotein translocase subunit SecE [Chloroflexota bacterium]